MHTQISMNLNKKVSVTDQSWWTMDEKYILYYIPYAYLRIVCTQSWQKANFLGLIIITIFFFFSRRLLVFWVNITSLSKKNQKELSCVSFVVGRWSIYFLEQLWRQLFFLKGWFFFGGKKRMRKKYIFFVYFNKSRKNTFLSSIYFFFNVSHSVTQLSWAWAINEKKVSEEKIFFLLFGEKILCVRSIITRGKRKCGTLSRECIHPQKKSLSSSVCKALNGIEIYFLLPTWRKCTHVTWLKKKTKLLILNEWWWWNQHKKISYNIYAHTHTQTCILSIRIFIFHFMWSHFYAKTYLCTHIAYLCDFFFSTNFFFYNGAIYS